MTCSISDGYANALFSKDMVLFLQSTVQYSVTAAATVVKKIHNAVAQRLFVKMMTLLTIL